MRSDYVVPEISTTRRRRAFRGAITGHAIEWYDYGVYGFLALYVGQQFFASSSPAVSLLSSFAVFALSFFIRPIGGLFFGPLADKVGRKKTLVIVMIMMSGATFLIGIIPTYASIGIAAPILLVLLRCIQGFSAGGEIGTVTSFLAEYAGPGRRGYSTSWLMVTAVLGLILGSLVANGLTLALGTDVMAEWGWRIPFIVAGPLGLIALYIRLKLEDSPEFQTIVESGDRSKAPLRETFKWGRAIALVFCIITVHASIFYLVLTFASTFMTEHLEFGSGVRFWFVILSGVLAAGVMPLGGLITDRFGRKRFLMASAIAATFSMTWFFVTAPGATPLSFFFPLMACGLTFGLYASSTYALMTELLPTRIRSTGIAVAYNLPVAVFGGSAPFIASWLINSTGNISSPAYFFAATGVISIVALLVLSQRDLDKAAAHIPQKEEEMAEHG